MPRPTKRPRLKLILAAGLLAILAATAWFAWVAFAVVPLTPKDGATSVEIDIRPGLGLRAAAQTLAEAGVGIVPWQFALLGRLAGRDRNIQAGSYEVGAGVTAWQLLGKLTAGDTLQAGIVIVEGKTFADLRAQIAAHPDLRHDSAAMSDAEILARIGAAGSHPEGRFFPDTYYFARFSSDLTIYRRAYQAMQRRLALAWANRAADLPLQSPEEALILASIVEKETGAAADRGKVASVFINRLRRGMPLQSDPTVIYGLGARFDGNLRKRDLQTDGPYNSYLRPGLPPTPIALPGQAALDATTRPEQTDYLYFVAKGPGSDGLSVFSRTLEAHNRAVNQYQGGGK